MIILWLTLTNIVADVRGNLANGDVDAAQALCGRARDAEGLEACSWIARYFVAHARYPEAQTAATEVRASSEALLAKRALDADAHLPIALGASIEVQAQAHADIGERKQAVTLLEAALARYRDTSIAARLQKNLNLLTLEGKPTPVLELTPTLTDTKAVLKKGQPTLLFFWAHWCPDCKQEAVDVAAIAQAFPRLAVLAPTQTYGFAEGGEDATPAHERVHMQEVWRDAYAPLATIAVPVSAANFVRFGGSSVPTLVLIDSAGTVALYHPGKMPMAALSAAIAKLF